MTHDTATSHVVADQSAVLAFLSDPKTYRMKAPPVRFDTHGAVVFLAGGDAYKMKRAVRFPFMDYSTLARRKAACEAEVAVNSPDAPTLYLGVMPVTRGERGLALGGDGEVVEWLVHMRRFDETQTLEHVAERDGLRPEMLAELVRAILASHARAPVRDGIAASQSLRRYLDQNDAAFRESPELFPAARVKALTERSKAVLERQWPLLVTRGQQGFVRRCHGDLHLRNIVLLDGAPTLFDAVEFDDAIATGDVLYDLAFLLMDLWERGLKSGANLVLNRYLWGSDERQLVGMEALPILLSIRAAIRSKVIAAMLPHLSPDKREASAGEAQQYFAAAEAFLQAEPPRLLAVGGLAGSGKTSLSATVAPRFGRPLGAVHLRSDIERKRLGRVGETESLPEGFYSEAATDLVYAVLRRKAQTALASGASVIVDAVHARADERDKIEADARETGAGFAGIWLDAPLPVLVERVAGRSSDASDATEAVVRTQAGYDLGAIRWRRLDATGPLESRAKEALRLVLESG